MNEQNEIVLYQPNELTKLEVRLAGDTVWLTQNQIADLFGVKQPAISKHLNNIFREGELDKNSVHSILEYTASDGKRMCNNEARMRQKMLLKGSNSIPL